MYATPGLIERELKQAFPPASISALRRALPMQQVAFVTTDVSETSDATVDEAVPQLALELLPGIVYMVYGFLRLNIGAAAGGAQIDFGGGDASIASTGYLNARVNYHGGAAEVNVYSVALGTALSGGTVNVHTGAIIEGIIRISSGRLLIPRFAQAGSNAAASVIQAGSYLGVTPLTQPR